MKFSYSQNLKDNYNIHALNNQYSLNIDVDSLTTSTQITNHKDEEDDGLELISSKSSEDQDIICLSTKFNNAEVLITSESEEDIPLAILSEKNNHELNITGSTLINNYNFETCAYEEKLDKILINTNVNPIIDDNQTLSKYGKKKCKKLNIEMDQPEDVLFEEIKTVSFYVRYMGNNNKIHNIKMKINERLENVLVHIYELEKIHLDTHFLQPISSTYPQTSKNSADKTSLMTKLSEKFKLFHKLDELSIFMTLEQLKLKSGMLLECLVKNSANPYLTAPNTSPFSIQNGQTTLESLETEIITDFPSIKLRIQHNFDIGRPTKQNPYFRSGSCENIENFNLDVATSNMKFYECLLVKKQPLMNALEKFCAALGLVPRLVQLQFDGEILDLNKTPEELELEDQDTLDAVTLLTTFNKK